VLTPLRLSAFPFALADLKGVVEEIAHDSGRGAPLMKVSNDAATRARAFRPPARCLRRR